MMSPVAVAIANGMVRIDLSSASHGLLPPLTYLISGSSLADVQCVYD